MHRTEANGKRQDVGPAIPGKTSVSFTAAGIANYRSVIQSAAKERRLHITAKRPTIRTFPITPIDRIMDTACVGGPRRTSRETNPR